MSAVTKAFGRQTFRGVSRTTNCAGRTLATQARTSVLKSLPVKCQLTRAAGFSTMAALKSNAPPSTAVREYDPEINDMANYIHNYKIDSDLAVCSQLKQQRVQRLTTIVRYRTLHSPRHPRMWSRSSSLQRMHQAPRTHCRRNYCPQWHSCSRYTIRP
jgi:hypothetical protein